MARYGSLSTILPSRNKTPSRPHWVVWMVLLALLFQNVVPFGQALAAGLGQDVEYQIICTANGIKQVPIGDLGEPIETQSTDFCPFCFTTSAPVFLEPQADVAVFHVVNHDERTFITATDVDFSSVWRSIPRPSRAPPVFI